MSDCPTVTYKPGWEFSWERANDLLFLRVRIGPPDAKAFDSATGELRDPPSSFLFVCPEPFNPMWLLLLLGDLEEHERREWIKLDGEQVFNPHVIGEPGSAVANRPSEWFTPTGREVDRDK